MILYSVLGFLLSLSIVLNIIFFFYLKRVLVKTYVASEQASEIFTHFDAFREHLQSLYERENFYGDETLNGLLEHVNEMIEYLRKYEEVYSFTQPDLEEQLMASSKDIEKEVYGTTETKEEAQKE